ncbi:MAG: hypothetical protein LBE37_16290 [Sphingobacterium sp.]|jgi:hypothetical protein|nr:hypothetical protein [Sphingobacterium sp.]
MALQWFHYTGTDPGNPSSYTKFGASEPTDCSAPLEQLCAIRADDGGGTQPVLDSTILVEMVRALQNQSNVTNKVLLKQR